MAFDPVTGMEKMPKGIDLGTNDDQYGLVAPGIYAPNDPPEYDPAKDKQNLFNTGQAGGSAYNSNPLYRQLIGSPQGGGFSAILGRLLGGGQTAATNPGFPGMPSPQSPDLGPSESGGAAPPMGDASGVSPALAAIMRGSDSTSGGSNIQAIMAQLLKSKKLPGVPGSGVAGNAVTAPLRGGASGIAGLFR